MNRASRCLCITVLVIIAVLVVAALADSVARATPDYALRTGKPCAYCHERPEGGGALNATGSAFARGGHQWPIPAKLEGQAAPSTSTRALRLIVGYIHLVMAVVWFGTIFYIHIVVRPQTLTSGIPRTERRLGWIAIGTMAGTGTVLTLLRYRETGDVFAGTFGTVFVIKLAQFGLLVAGATIATAVLDRRMRTDARSKASAPSSAEATATESLGSLDGKESRKAVVAVEGQLYDVTASRMWAGGVHARRHQAGQDLTQALKGAPHGAEVLQRVPRIGVLQAAAGTESRRRPSAHRAFVAMAYFNLVLVAGILLCVAWWKWGFSLRSDATEKAGTSLAISKESAQCIACHYSNELMRAQIGEWQRGKMAASGVACYECHRAQSSDADARNHNGFTVSVLVTPKDCARCHPAQVEQFASSRHSRGGDILASLDNVLGEKVEGAAAAVAGCKQCHGSMVELDPNGIPLPASWPNTGIGRINPDDSRGACSTCHTRHLFSVAVAREPGSCGNCHMGPDHPQKEIYEESKHGVAFVANREAMKLDITPWVLGQDYTAAPTCATCHMSAIPGVAVNHDVGQRIAWNLRPVISLRQENSEARRQAMQQVCQQCHSPPFYQNFFTQFDNAVDLYHIKFAVPAQEIMQRLRAANKLTLLDFDEPMEWTYYLLWHHEGRRARHGAAMMGPDYVQWHGFFEVADRFYNEFVPSAEALLPGVTEPFLQEPAHQWRLKK